jgi:hypothetical protein
MRRAAFSVRVIAPDMSQTKSNGCCPAFMLGRVPVLSIAAGAATA